MNEVIVGRGKDGHRIKPRSYTHTKKNNTITRMHFTVNTIDIAKTPRT